MLNKSLIKARRPYEDRLEIITLCERLKSFYEKYKGTCESIVPGVETVWFDNPEYQRELVWTLNQKRDYVTNIFNGMAEIRPTILLYYGGKKDVYEVLDGKQPLTDVERPNDFFAMFKPEYYIEMYGNKDNYAKDCASFSTFAMLLDGEWHEQGKMGWFAISGTTKESLEKFTDFMDKTLRDLKKTHPNAKVTLVDCHI